VIELLNIDCMEYMKGCEDNAFDLCIVDPQYGIGESGKNNASRGKLAVAKDYKPFHGDDLEPMPKEYFIELERISRNRIIWDKVNGSSDFADCELAYTSFKSAVRKFTYQWSGMLQQDMKNKEIRIHPTQKPMRLYQWLLTNYAEPGQKIFDSHLGSGSSAIAAHYFCCDFVGCEIDEDYYKAACERFDKETRQLDLLGEL